MKMKVLFASLLLAASGQVLAQSSGQVGGQVFDENGDPVVGAQIMVKGSKTGTVTDIDGKFSLPSAIRRGDSHHLSRYGFPDLEGGIWNEGQHAFARPSAR